MFKERRLFKEKYINDNNEHFILLKKLYENIIDKEINEILDCGTGKTSLSSLLDNFKQAKIDAFLYYNDQRKINSVKENIISERINLIERDICKDKTVKKYDLVLAHLLLGESIMWGNTFGTVFNSLINIKTKYLIIVDFKEDKVIDYEMLESYLIKNNYEIITKIEQLKNEPQVFKNFTGKTYIGYVLKK